MSDAYQPALLYYTCKIIGLAWTGRTVEYKKAVGAWFDLFNWKNFKLELGGK